MEGISEGDWLTSIDLKDAYFHIRVQPRHRKYLRFFFQGTGYQYRVLPFGYSLAPRTFTMVLQTALEPLLRTGIIIRYHIQLPSHSVQLMHPGQAGHQNMFLSHLGFSIIWAFDWIQSL